MNRSGFTLLELMIVVAIIAFLAMLAMPNLMHFLAKAKRAEAYMNLHSIYAAEKAYFAENGTFSSVLNGQGGIGWKPEGYKGGGKNEKFHYTYGFPGSEGKSFFTGNLETPSSHLSCGKADKTGFVAVATGYINGQEKPDVITIDQDNSITILEDALA